MNIYDKSFISKKAAESGFNRDTYEKVLRLVDILDFINHDAFLDKKLALKGGTAINLLEFPLPRLSVVFYHVLTSDEINGKFHLTAANKLNQNSILRELVPVLKRGEVFIFKEALDSVTEFVDDLMKMTESELKFIEHFNGGEYRPELLFENQDIINRICDHPMAKWKASKLST